MTNSNNKNLKISIDCNHQTKSECKHIYFKIFCPLLVYQGLLLQNDLYQNLLPSYCHQPQQEPYQIIMCNQNISFHIFLARLLETQNLNIRSITNKIVLEFKQKFKTLFKASWFFLQAVLRKLQDV